MERWLSTTDDWLQIAPSLLVLRNGVETEIKGRQPLPPLNDFSLDASSNMLFVQTKPYGHSRSRPDSELLPLPPDNGFSPLA